MIKTSADTILALKGSDLIEFSCDVCSKTFARTKRQYRAQVSHITGGSYKKAPKRHICSPECFTILKGKGSEVKCAQCGTPTLKSPSEALKSKSGRSFCGSSCAGKYNSAHKTFGCRSSKLERWVAEQLTSLYPELEVHYNRKDAIGSELDIYVPSLKLAFELNGIFHYEPIYGHKTFENIQNNDHRKFAACAEREIGLCVIDTSKQKYFKPSTSQPYLDIIVKIINQKLIALAAT